MFTRFTQFLRQTSGQDLAEYGLLTSLIALVTLAALRLLGVAIADLWGRISAGI